MRGSPSATLSALWITLLALRPNLRTRNSAGRPRVTQYHSRFLAAISLKEDHDSVVDALSIFGARCDNWCSQDITGTGALYASKSRRSQRRAVTGGLASDGLRAEALQGRRSTSSTGRLFVGKPAMTRVHVMMRSGGGKGCGFFGVPPGRCDTIRRVFALPRGATFTLICLL